MCCAISSLNVPVQAAVADGLAQVAELDVLFRAQIGDGTYSQALPGHYGIFGILPLGAYQFLGREAESLPNPSRTVAGTIRQATKS